MLTDKKYEKLVKVLGEDSVKDLDALSAEDLKSRIVAAEEAIKVATDELEANEKYQLHKQAVADLNKGLSDLKKRQKAITQYSLHLLEEKGK